MGSLPRLKIKDEIHYRKGSTNESNNCRACAGFVKDYLSILFSTSVGRQIECRCKIIGLKEGARYRVREDHTCDRHVMSEPWRKELTL